MDQTSILRIPVAAVSGLAALLLTSYAVPPGSSAAQAQSGAASAVCAAGAPGLTLGFVSEFAGVSQDDHTSNVWSGRVSGPVQGELRVTLEPLGSLMETANPVWRVRTRWLVSPSPSPSPAAPGERSLVAELYGTVNWKTGVMRLAGIVTEGCLKGYEAVASGRFADLDGEGTLQMQPAIALR